MCVVFYSPRVPRCSKQGQNSADDLKTRDLKAELLEREQRAAEGTRRGDAQSKNGFPVFFFFVFVRVVTRARSCYYISPRVRAEFITSDNSSKVERSGGAAHSHANDDDDDDHDDKRSASSASGIAVLGQQSLAFIVSNITYSTDVRIRCLPDLYLCVFLLLCGSQIRMTKRVHRRRGF